MSSVEESKNVYHMTRTDPRAISLENHMKKVPYEGRTPRSSRAGKKAGTKPGPDQLGSLDPGRIDSDQPGSTRIGPDR